MTDAIADRELLELAAKAAGIQGEYAGWHQAYGDTWVVGINTGGRLLWNPLTDDGDALRLAVKRNFEISTDSNGDDEVSVSGYSVSTGGFTVFEEHGNDKLAAVRRAITRAAAATGKVMP